MTFYSQQNSAYKNILMGYTSRKIGNEGCTISCLGMVSDKNPEEVNRLMTTRGGYYYDPVAKIWTNLVYWEPACAALGNLRFIRRDRFYDNNRALEAIKKYGFALAEVDFDGNLKTSGKHWIVLLGNKKMNDPWSTSKHPEPTSKYKEFTGLAVLQRL